MTTSSKSSASLLPVELERPIFELAAWKDRRTAHDLLFVAQRVRLWIEPIVYTVVTLIDSEEHVKRPRPSCLNRFMNVFKAKSPEFFLSSVKHICLAPTTSFELEEAISILSTCTNVQNLAYGGAIYTWEDIISLLHSAHLRRLSMELPRHSPMQGHVQTLAPYLRNITHLDVLSVWPTPALLDLLPNLTHLALDFDQRDEDHFPLLARLCERENLVVVAFIVHSQGDVESGIVEGYGRFEEVRFIPLLFESESIASDWHASTVGGKDMWWRAEEALKRRQRELRQFYNLLTFHEKDD